MRSKIAFESAAAMGSGDGAANDGGGFNGYAGAEIMASNMNVGDTVLAAIDEDVEAALIADCDQVHVPCSTIK